MTAYGTVETAVEASEVRCERLYPQTVFHRSLERVILNLQATTASDEQEAPMPPEARAILTQDPGMIRLLTTLEGGGEPGYGINQRGKRYGKELLARYIHAEKPLAPIVPSSRSQLRRLAR